VSAAIDGLADYIEARGLPRPAAERIVRDVLVRDLASLGTIRVSSVGWIYRIVRNAILECGPSVKTADGNAYLDSLRGNADDASLREAICHYLAAIATGIASELADALTAIDLQREPVDTYAKRVGISAETAATRVQEAREATRARITVATSEERDRSRTRR
jgi:DNA-directed RNA polymerase specialized sigma24 family protein